MARTSVLKDLVQVTSQIPAWLALALGAGLFWLFKYFLPAQTSGTYAPILSQALVALAYVSAGACILGAVIGIARRKKEESIYKRQTSIESIRALSWQDFERMMVAAFRDKGYVAQPTSAGPDGGVDILLRKDGEVSLVQCKQWKTARIGVRPIRELAGVVASEKASRGIFVCSGDYTNEAIDFARRANIELIDGRQLAILMKLEAGALARQEPKFDQQEVSCPRCGSPLVRRTARRGKNAGNQFMGCSGFPKCRYTSDV